jgi:Tfp pilus assembly PilM family ATPase
MRLFSSKQTSKIGLDISEDAIRLLQLESNGSHRYVKAACHCALPRDLQEEDLRSYRKHHYYIQAIRQMMQENNFKGRSVRVSFSFDQLEYGILQVHKSVQQNVRQTVRSQARDQFGFEEHFGTVDLWESGDVGNQADSYQQFIAFGASDYTLQNMLLMLEDVHLKCAGIEPMPCALYRSVSQNSAEDGSRLIVGIGASYSVVMTGRGNCMTSIKRVDYGMEDFTDTRPNSYDFLVDPKEELVKKISDCLQYHQTVFQMDRPTELILTGEQINTDLVKFLEEKSFCKVRWYFPFAGIDTSAVKAELEEGTESSVWSVVLGLCLKDTVSDKVAV